VLPDAPTTLARGRFAIAQVCSPRMISPPPSNVMYRAGVLRSVGGVPPGDNLFEDQRTMLVVSLRGPVHVTDDVLATYTVRPDSLYGSLVGDLHTRRVQRRRYERWLLATALRGGVPGIRLFARAALHLAGRAVRRGGRALRRALGLGSMPSGNGPTVATSSAALRVVIATRGRPAEAKALFDSLAAQTRPPDVVVVVGTHDDDLFQPDPDTSVPYVGLVSPRPGLTIQRNFALEHLREQLPVADGIVVFFDDDFRPHREWLERCERVFAADDRIVGLTGWVIADGIGTSEISEGTAAELLVSAEPMPLGLRWKRASSLYGCNMAFRERTLVHHRFCEELPLYGWLEDVDYSGQVRTSGDLVNEWTCVGVHRGVDTARIDLRQLGYSEIVNPLWLRRRRTISVLRCARIVARRTIAAAVHSVMSPRSENYRERFRGVTMAFTDLARGRLHPMRIIELAPTANSATTPTIPTPSPSATGS